MLKQLTQSCRIPHWIGGQPIAGDAADRLELCSPLDGTPLGEVPLGSANELDAAVAAAVPAQRQWARVALKDRVQVCYRLKALMEERCAELAELITRENGKLDVEARGEIARGIECVEFAASLPQIAAGRF